MRVICVYSQFAGFTAMNVNCVTVRAWKKMRIQLIPEGHCVIFRLRGEHKVGASDLIV